MVFPEYRPRRMRQNETFRAMIRETRLDAAQMIYPLFVLPGKGVREEVPSMPGVFRLSVDQLAKEAKDCLDLGVRPVIRITAYNVCYTKLLRSDNNALTEEHCCSHCRMSTLTSATVSTSKFICHRWTPRPAILFPS